MIELLLAGRASLGKTLEIGAGCGYQAAVLAQLTREVFGVERLAPAAGAGARQPARQLKLTRIRLKHGDGMAGLPEAAPFDTIIVAAAGAAVPQALRDQLALGWPPVIPVGSGDAGIGADRTQHSRVGSKRVFDAVRFVPLLPGVA